MSDICETLSAESNKRIKELIDTAKKTKENQNALVEDGKIISVVSGGRPAHRIAGDGKGIVYAPAPPKAWRERTTRAEREEASREVGIPLDRHSFPTSADLVEMVGHDRPFSCRAIELAPHGRIPTGGRAADNKILACFTPNEDSYPIAEMLIDDIVESKQDWKQSLQYWIQHNEPPVEHEGNLFEMAMRRELNWRSLRGKGVLREFASEALDKCEVKL